MTFVISTCTYFHFQLAAFLSAYGCDMFGLLINGRLVGRYTAAGVYVWPPSCKRHDLFCPEPIPILNIIQTEKYCL